MPLDHEHQHQVAILLCRRLVVQGLYSYTRNPMFLGVFAIVFGEALICNSLALLWYFLALVAAQMVSADPTVHALSTFKCTVLRLHNCCPFDIRRPHEGAQRSCCAC